MIQCSQKVRSVCPYRKTCGGGVYKEGSDCDKFAESLQNKKAHNPGGGPITREQVEKMRGEWVYMTDDDGCAWPECSKCEHELDSLEEPQNFCPRCGSPMTDEAVDILWARLEAMQDEAETD